MNRTLTTSIWTLTACALFAVAPAAHAEQTPKEEAIGLGAGAVIGAAAGGPVGFVIGAGLGAMLGDSLHDKDSEIGTLNESLSDTQATTRELEADLDAVSAALTRAEQAAQPELVAMLTGGIAVDFAFRTDEHVLTDQYGSRLWSLAQSLADNPQINVQLDGFADERGDADYNMALSAKRIEFVRQQLIAAGVNAERIRETAHGESPAMDSTPDSYALERRVSLTLYLPAEGEAVAAN